MNRLAFISSCEIHWHINLVIFKTITKTLFCHFQVHKAFLKRIQVVLIYFNVYFFFYCGFKLKDSLIYFLIIFGSVMNPRKNNVVVFHFQNSNNFFFISVTHINCLCSSRAIDHLFKKITFKVYQFVINSDYLKII